MGSPTSIRTSNFCSPVATPAAMVSNLYALPPLVGGQFIPLVVAPVEGDLDNSMSAKARDVEAGGGVAVVGASAQQPLWRTPTPWWATRMTR